MKGQIMNDGAGIAEAVKVLRRALKNDEAYYYSWQTNIAMAFQDEFMKYHRHQGTHEISNNAAKVFLGNLIGGKNEINNK